MQVRLVTRPDEFAALRPAWDALHGRLPHPSIFLSHAWFDAAWQWRRRDADLHLLCCERAGDLAGVLPLVRPRAGPGPAGPRTLELLTIPDTQRCDVLVAHDDPAIANALTGELRRRRGEWDVLRLSYLPSDTSALGAWQQTLQSARLRLDVAENASNPWIDLGGTWEAFYATRSRRLKKAVNLAANRLGKLGRIDVEWLAPGTGTPADVDAVVAAITGISARSWKTSTGNSLDNAGPQAFLRQLASSAHALGALSVWTLELDGAPVAMELQLIDRGIVYALRSDFDATLGEASPGSHLSRQLLERLFGRNLTRYCMGPGENAYKYRWTEQAAPVHTLSVYSPTARGAAFAAWELTLKPGLKRWARQLRANGFRARADAQGRDNAPGETDGDTPPVPPANVRGQR
jgi:CelD/BcsL family acetyltransferase involved in cellulose biosynthesis